MALYSLKCRPLQRSKGHSATGLGCYMLDQEGIDPWDNKNYMQENRHDHDMTAMSFSPVDNDPFDTPLSVFQNIDAFEKRKDASLGKEYEIALQNELSRQQNIETVKSFCQKIVDEGKYAVASIHWKNENPHVHVWESDRPFYFENGKPTWGKKSNTPQANLDLLQRRREGWEQCVNAEFEKAGLEIRIDHRSYKDQGKDWEREIHEGKNPSLDILERNAKVRQKRMEHEHRVVSGAVKEIEEVRLRISEVENAIEKLMAEAEQNQHIPSVRAGAIPIAMPAPFTVGRTAAVSPKRVSSHQTPGPSFGEMERGRRAVSEKELCSAKMLLGDDVQNDEIALTDHPTPVAPFHEQKAAQRGRKPADDLTPAVDVTPPTRSAPPAPRPTSGFVVRRPPEIVPGANQQPSGPNWGDGPGWS